VWIQVPFQKFFVLFRHVHLSSTLALKPSPDCRGSPQPLSAYHELTGGACVGVESLTRLKSGRRDGQPPCPVNNAYWIGWTRTPNLLIR